MRAPAARNRSKASDPTTNVQPLAYRYRTICALIPEVEKNGKFQGWTPLAGEESSWNNKIDNFFAETQNPNYDDKTKYAEPYVRRFDNYELVKLLPVKNRFCDLFFNSVSLTFFALSVHLFCLFHDSFIYSGVLFC